jgi:hypothetical protein
MATDGEVKDIHTNESTKTLLKSEALYEVRPYEQLQYIYLSRTRDFNLT